MDATAIFVIVFGLLFFVGGGAWLEIHSRRKKRAESQDEQSPSPAATAPTGRTVYRRVAASE